MRAVDIIAKKRDGQVLTKEEITWFIDAFTREDLPDYQAAAFLMAVCIRGMTRQETIDLTLAMAHSGEVLDLSSVLPYAVDKHSSGGVGDKTSLVVLPLVAACGIPVAKMSGRGLGFSGGTLDKLESIAGFRVELSDAEFLELARTKGLVLAGQTKDLAPADGKLYALRDVTATVPSLPLIASSIMSKKIAAGANGIVLDVKTGSGAFMTTQDEAYALAQMMVDIGKGAGKDVIAVISDMNQPLGNAVGNALEIREAVETLGGGGPDDFRQHSLEIAGHMVRLAGQGKQWTNEAEVRAMLESHLTEGRAFLRFREMVLAQGGDVGMVDDPSKLPQARITQTVQATESGFIAQMSALEIAMAALELGAGRAKKGDPIDHAVGVIAHRKVGDRVGAGDALFEVHANREETIAPALARLESAVAYSPQPVEPLPLFYDTLDGN